MVLKKNKKRIYTGDIIFYMTTYIVGNLDTGRGDELSKNKDRIRHWKMHHVHNEKR